MNYYKITYQITINGGELDGGILKAKTSRVVHNKTPTLKSKIEETYRQDYPLPNSVAAVMITVSPISEEIFNSLDRVKSLQFE